MYRIIDGRSTGKTSRLLLLAKENNGIVVCAYPEWMKEKAYKYGLVGIDFISYEEFIDNIKEHSVAIPVYDLKGTQILQYPTYRKGFHSEKPIFVDNLELLFNKICLSQFSGFTLSNED